MVVRNPIAIQAKREQQLPLRFGQDILEEVRQQVLNLPRWFRNESLANLERC